MSNNVINVTACDNELIVLACQWNASFELFRVLSGNANTVAVNMTIQSGQYAGTQVFDGVNNALNTNATCSLAPGTYNLCLVGINWGGQQQFTVTINGDQLTLPYTTQPDEFQGVVWAPKSTVITV